MATGFVWHERYAWHDARGLLDTFGRGALFEPEPSLESGSAKRRLRNLIDAAGLLASLTEIDPRPLEDDALKALHAGAYLDRIRTASARHGGDAGGSTPFGRWTYELAALAAGGCVAAVDAVLDARVDNAYALVRPPGHHAGPSGGCGYCVFNNVALAGLHLRSARGLARVAIVDWDVHHGNGTQEAFWTDPSVLTISLHQEDLFPPGSGLVTESGADAGTGANINLPLPAGAGRAAYLAALDRLMAAAASVCDGRIVACHEGGYSTAYVPYCGLAIIEVLAGVTSEVADPWLTDARRVREIPLRTHEREAIDEAAALHGL